MGGDATITPVIPPIKKFNMKPMEKSIGVVKTMEPRHIVPIQLKNLIPVGTAMRNRKAPGL